MKKWKNNRFNLIFTCILPFKTGFFTGMVVFVLLTMQCQLQVNAQVDSLSIYKARYANKAQAYNLIKESKDPEVIKQRNKMKIDLANLKKTIKKIEWLVNTVELNEKETIIYKDLSMRVSGVAEYTAKWKAFMENLKKTNPAHLKELIKYYDEHPHWVDVSLANVSAYIAYCGKNWKIDMWLWKAIKTNDINLHFDYEDFSDIYSKYSKIK